MLLGHINMRIYIAIAAGVGAMVYLVGLLAGPQLTSFFLDLQGNALSLGVSEAITTIVLGPFIFVFSEPAIGAIISGLFWPLILVWLILLFLLFIVLAFMGGYNSAATGTDQFNP